MVSEHHEGVLGCPCVSVFWGPEKGKGQQQGGELLAFKLLKHSNEYHCINDTFLLYCNRGARFASPFSRLWELLLLVTYSITA